MTPEQTAQLREIFKGAQKRSIRIGDRLHVILGTPEELEAKAPEINAMIRKALDRGRTVTENGVAQWISKEPLHNPRATLASDQYKWHADGNRVKARKMLVTKQPDGTIRKKQIGYGWTDLD